MSTSSFDRLWDQWSHWAEVSPDAEAIIHYAGGKAEKRWTRGHLMTRARAFAGALAGAGVVPGDVCALVMRHHPDFYPLYLGIVGTGAVPAVLAYPNQRLHPDKFVHGLTGMATHSGLRWIATERALEASLQPLVTGAASSVHALLFPLEWKLDSSAAPGRLAGADANPDQPCLLQHSSGTTGLQKAVEFSHRTVLTHVRDVARAIALGPDDTIASWLPLYHDMGMIAAFQLPLATGTRVVQLDPFEWVAAPGLLFQAMADEGASIAWLPNFAYHLLADRVHDEEMEGLRLDRVRLLINCSEPVRADSHLRLLRKFEPVGLTPRALGACYAMAEATFAVTQTAPGSPPRELAVSPAGLASGDVILVDTHAAARVCVSSGAPLPGTRVRVVDDAGQDVGPGRVGELWIHSATLFDGYRNRPDETARVLQHGWYRSGDLGFCWDGEYYVIGRKKDVIIVAGKNVYPEDVEAAVSAVPELIPGRIVAFGADDTSAGTELVCVVAETLVVGETEQQALRVAILRAAMAFDITVSRVYLAPPRWLIKSSAGKPSRKLNRERILSGALEAL